MLVVKTYVDKSTIEGAGLGLFAGEDLKKGQIIWKFNPIFDSRIHKDMIKNLTEVEEAYLKEQCYREGNAWIILGDNSHFMNHDSNPNIIHGIKEEVAARDIKQGDELFCDYREVCDDIKENGLPWEVKEVGKVGIV